MKKILFITGTRADYGKLKSLIQKVENSSKFEAYIFVSGMHLVETYGHTYLEVLKDNYKNVHVAFGLSNSHDMSYNLGDIICNLTGYVKNIKPDMIVIHGDRIDALAGAVVGALNNIKTAHIEGGELSGTIDESIRHAISKFAHIHFVCNEEARQRLIQLGEEEKRIYIIGSPDIDIMKSNTLPSLKKASNRYEIDFSKYAILMYHPVTTEFKFIQNRIKEIVDSAIESNRKYIVIYPNNDLGSEVILNEYNRLKTNSNFAVFPSLRFEYFLTFLKNADFVIGNSSAGVRETSIYGIPTIDIGTRQNKRYSLENATNIQHTNESKCEILEAINKIDNYRFTSQNFGYGNSKDLFMKVINHDDIWDFHIQKKFVDLKSEDMF